MHKNCSPPASWFAWLSTPFTSEWRDTIWEMMNTGPRQLYRRRLEGKDKQRRRQSSNRNCCLKGVLLKKNASRRCIQILCQPSKPDLMGFSIKSWTWQVTAIYSAGTVEKRLIKITQCDNEAILVLSFVYFYIYFLRENRVWRYCLLTKPTPLSPVLILLCLWNHCVH